MKYSLTFLLAITCLIVNAQTIQWASKVVKVSSQRSTTKGGAANQAFFKTQLFSSK
jgi:hypothetical protein